MAEFLHLASLLWGTVIHRPYVYAFFVCYLAFGLFQLGPKKISIHLVIAYLIALAAVCSTRWSFPFGMYVYIDTARAQELWISNVPFWDSLSFVFLSYFSWMLAAGIRRDRSLGQPMTFALAGLLMMLLDVVIDPLSLRGDQWFLGKIYYYPAGGIYFGVTAANFAGWWLVGTVTPWVYHRIARPVLREVPKIFFWGVYGVYAGVFLFNLGVTFWIGEWKLLAASVAVAGTTLAFSAAALRNRSVHA